MLENRAEFGGVEEAMAHEVGDGLQRCGEELLRVVVIGHGI